MPDESNAKKGYWTTGELVPRTGTYECRYCGPSGNGTAFINHLLQCRDYPNTVPPSTLKEPSRFFLQSGGFFPSCPNCKNYTGEFFPDPTRWHLISGKDDETTTKKGGGGCFIATVCYGSADCDEVLEFRRFRDQVLVLSWFGRLIVHLYYSISPPIAALLRRKSILRAFVKECFLKPTYFVIRVREKSNRRQSSESQK